jgi:hypothetical protein
MTGRERDYYSAADMLAMAREALEQWRKAPAGRAAERHAGRKLAFAFGRLDDVCDLAAAPEREKGKLSGSTGAIEYE